MKEKLLNIAAMSLAGIVIMIFHELPKSMIYAAKAKNQSKKAKRNIYKVLHYIDPIGLILFITTYAGFSKPYMYRIKDRMTNFMIGIAGFVSLFTMFSISFAIYYYVFGNLENMKVILNNLDFHLFFILFIRAMMIFSINMILVNLFPVSTFDLGLVIAGKSPNKYFAIIRGDFIIKIILLFSILLGIIPTLGTTIIDVLLMLVNKLLERV